MPVEIEAKFLNVVPDDVRARLSCAGFVCAQPRYLMRRVVFDIPGQDYHSWARVRDENGTITVSYKRTHDGARIDGTEEVQIVSDDFDNACLLLQSLGMIRKSYQETWREVWLRGAVEVTIDEWPALAPFVELEAPEEKALRDAAAELGFDWQNAVFGAVGSVYEMTGISAAAINQFPRVTFQNVDQLLALKKTA